MVRLLGVWYLKYPGGYRLVSKNKKFYNPEKNKTGMREHTVSREAVKKRKIKKLKKILDIFGKGYIISMLSAT